MLTWPGNCCSHTDCGTSVCTINFNVKGCNSLNFPGASWTAVQSGVTIASGTTNSSGNFSFTTPNLPNVTVTITESSGRFNTSVVVVTPVCGSTINRNVTLVVNAAYVCICSTCLYPAPTTIHFTSPSGAVLAAMWNAGTAQWLVNEAWSVPVCDKAGNQTVTVQWQIDGCGNVWEVLFVCSSKSSCTPCSDSYPTPTSWSPLTCVTVTKTSFTCPLSSAFAGSGTISSSVANGNWSFTE